MATVSRRCRDCNKMFSYMTVGGYPRAWCVKCKAARAVRIVGSITAGRCKHCKSKFSYIRKIGVLRSYCSPACVKRAHHERANPEYRHTCCDCRVAYTTRTADSFRCAMCNLKHMHAMTRLRPYQSRPDASVMMRRRMADPKYRAKLARMASLRYALKRTSRVCTHCHEVYTPKANVKYCASKFCSPRCNANFRHRTMRAQEGVLIDSYALTKCEECESLFSWSPSESFRRPKYCSDACQKRASVARLGKFCKVNSRVKRKKTLVEVSCVFCSKTVLREKRYAASLSCGAVCAAKIASATRRVPSLLWLLKRRRNHSVVTDSRVLKDSEVRRSIIKVLIGEQYGNKDTRRHTERHVTAVRLAEKRKDRPSAGIGTRKHCRQVA